jgi:hypothetical protein
MPRRSRRKYWVDWRDNSFPAIRLWDFEGMDESTVPEPMTLAGAKREIIGHFEEQVVFARGRIRETRQLTAEDIEDGEQ